MIIFLLLLFIVSWFCYTSTLDYGYIIGISVFLCICLGLFYKKSRFINDSSHPKLDRFAIYHNVQHGDIIFTAGYEKQSSLESILTVINKGVSHTALITEENGIKYITHAWPGTPTRPYIDKKKIFHSYGPDFYLYKEELMSSLTYNPHTLFYQVYRHPSKTLHVDTIKLPDDRMFYFCSASVSETLVKNKIIPYDGDKILSYQPDQIIHQLNKNGYQSFYMIHDRSLDL